MATGYPDYGLFVTPGRTDIRTGQTRYSLAASASYPAGTTSATVYTIPTGYRLFIGFLKMTCNYSCIQSAVLYRSGTAVCQADFDTVCTDPPGADSGFVYEAGETIDVDIINNDVDAHNFRLTMLGWLVKV